MLILQSRCSLALIVKRLPVATRISRVVVHFGLIHFHYPNGWYVAGPDSGGMEWTFVLLVCLPGARFNLNDRKILTANIELRLCTAADASALALIGQSTFLETFAGVLPGADIIAHCKKAHATALYSEWLADPAFRLWLAEAPGGAPVGFMLMAPPDLPLPDVSDSDAEIKRIYLLSRFQGGGVGKRFIAEAVLHAAERKATRLLLGVYANNHAAIGFYERSGFSKVGTRQFNVGGNVYDDFIMGRSL